MRHSARNRSTTNVTQASSTITLPMIATTFVLAAVVLAIAMMPVLPDSMHQGRRLRLVPAESHRDGRSACSER
jgi:hypothetical protein